MAKKEVYGVSADAILIAAASIAGGKLARGGGTCAVDSATAEASVKEAFMMLKIVDRELEKRLEAR